MTTAAEELKRRRNWGALVATATGDNARAPDPGPLIAALMSWRTAFQVVHRRAPLADDYPRPVKGFLACLAEARPRRGPRGFSDARALAVRRAWDDALLTLRYQQLRDEYAFAGRQPWAEYPEYSRQSFCGDRPSELALDRLAQESHIKAETLRPRVQRRRRNP